MAEKKKWAPTKMFLQWCLSYLLISVIALTLLLASGYRYLDVLRDNLEYTNGIQLDMTRVWLDQKVKLLRNITAKESSTAAIEAVRQADDYDDIPRYDYYMLTRKISTDVINYGIGDAYFLYFPSTDAIVSNTKYGQSRRFYDLVLEAYDISYEDWMEILKQNLVTTRVFQPVVQGKDTARLGIYDGYAYPWGFGVSPESGTTPDLTEPIRLVHELHDELGLDMVNLTMGNPYATTHVTRPFDFGKYEPDEHPFVGLSRMIHGIGAVKKAVPEMTVWASAPTYLRAYADLFSAGAVEQGLCDGMLFGRMAFADPDFANEIVKNGRIDPKRVCLTCGKCGDLIRAHKPTGCVIRDSKTFMPFYKEFLEIKKTQPANFRG